MKDTIHKLIKFACFNIYLCITCIFLILFLNRYQKLQTEIVIIIFKYNWFQKMDRIRAKIQEKIANRSSDINNDSTLSLAEETKKNLLKMFDQYQDTHSISSEPAQISKYNNKFEDLDYLNQARMKVSELTMANDRLKMELLQSNKNILAIKQMLDKERSRASQQQSSLIVKQKKKQQQIRIQFQARIEKNLKYIDELLEEKAKFNEKTQMFLLQKKKLQKAILDQKQKFRVQSKAKVDAVEANEKQKRIKWQQAKIIELKQTTIKGMQPQLNSIIARSRNEIKATQQRCERQKAEFKQECQKQFQKYRLQFKEVAFKQHQAQKQRLRIQYSNKLKEQYDKMQVQFANDRQKMRQTYKSDIQDLQYKRKNQQQQFMKKNRQTYDEYLTQVKRVRDDYQDRIKILEGSRQKYIEAQKQKLEIKYQNISKDQIQKYKREQRQKIESAYAKLQEEYQRKQEDAFNKMAIMNSQLQKDLQIKYQNKRKDQKRLFEDQIKKLKRNVSVLEQKLQKQNKTSGEVSKQKDHFQTKYMELKIQYDQIVQQYKQNKLKIKELEKEIDSLNLNFNKDVQTKVAIERATKQKQINNLRKLIQKQEQDKIIFEKNNQSKIKQNQKKWAQEMCQLEKRARKVLDKKDTQIDNLRKQVKKHEQLSKGYQGMLQKQRQQLMASLYK